MQYIQVERVGTLAVIKLARPKANAMTGRMIEELATALDELSICADVRALVLGSEQPKFFSSGFDVAEVFAVKRDEMHSFFGRFLDVIGKLQAFPKPTVAAVSGHAFAGGAVAALACDFRIMADGPFGFALNEINLGIAVTPGLIHMAKEAVGPHARSIVLAGETVTPPRALEIGLARELAAPEEVLTRAKAMAADLAEKPAGGYALAKRWYHSPPNDHKSLDAFVEQWFSPECVAKRTALTESMKK